MRSTQSLSGGKKSYSTIPTIMRRKMTYHEGEICAEFHSDILIGGRFIYWKIKESVLIKNCVVWEFGAVVARFRSFSHCYIRMLLQYYAPNSVEIGIIAREIKDFTIQLYCPIFSLISYAFSPYHFHCVI